MLKSARTKILTLFLGAGFIVGLVFGMPKLFRIHFVAPLPTLPCLNAGDLPSSRPCPSADVTVSFTPHYVSTPPSVKGIYMTSWTGSSPVLRGKLVKLIDGTELNSVVIDIKDYSGKIVFPIKDPILKSYGSEEIRIKDLRDFIESLHQKNIYVIGRVAVFQDAYFVAHRPDLAVKNLAGTSVWKDHKGISWIDPGSTEYWQYIVLLSKESRKEGFDEINFDYIRFPSDGDLHNISYPFSSTTPKTVILKNFFAYLQSNLVVSPALDQVSGYSSPRPGLGLNTEDNRLKISADIFGMVTSAKDDMGIGQYYENFLPYFDYISPMVYPSHYASGFQNYKNPAEHPYEVVKYALSEAVRRSNFASSTPDKIRPWLQDFSLGANYGQAEVRSQIRAVNENGLQSWFLWSASNVYTASALEK